MAKSQRSKTINKVSRALNGYKAPRPRTRIGHMSDAGALVSSTYITGVLATGAAAQSTGIMPCAPAQNDVNSDAGGAVIRNYQEYRMKHATLKYTPAVGTTTVGIVHIAYYDNPEIIKKWLDGTYNAATQLLLCKTAPISSSAPVWMEQNLAASMQTRRSKYAVNKDFTGLTVADYDLQVHGVFFIATEGVPFSTSYGLFTLDYSVHGFHLQSANISGI